MEKFDNVIVNLLAPAAGRTVAEIEALLELPQLEKGDRAVPCFRWAKEAKMAPQAFAESLKQKIETPSLPEEIERVEVQGGYLNFFLRRSILSREVLGGILGKASGYGFVEAKADRPTAVIEFSSPNIAKPFAIGHLRSTNIGAALCRIFEARGWKVIRINHLGDWGTQFGRLIVAYRRWGSAELLGDQPILNLFKLYVRFHEQEVSDPTLVEEAREWVSRLERGDAEAMELWEWFRDLTLLELKRLYKVLGVEFDHYWGESYYLERLTAVFEALEKAELTRISDEATIIDLEAEGLGTCIVKKSDESSVYLTRDLAAALFRWEQFQFDRMIYVVGMPQQLHFKQLFKVLEKLGHKWTDRCEHIPFGHISFGDEAMSTRKGNVVFLSEVLDRAVDLARKIVREKNPDLEDAENVAQAVGLGAILFADLSAKRTKDVKFSWEEMLSFDGETGPYLQYSLVRTRSLLRKSGAAAPTEVPSERLIEAEEVALIRHLAMFPMTLARAERDREPFLLSKYLIDVARLFNRFYQAHRILDAAAGLREARLGLTAAAGNILETGLKLLGVPTLEKM